MNISKIKILIIEDEVLISNFIYDCIAEDNRFVIEIASNEAEALEKLDNFLPNIILMDINIEGANKGLYLAEQRNKDSKIIYVTAQNDLFTIEKAISTKPESYLTKPIKKSDLLASINIALSKIKNSFVSFKLGYDDVKISKDEIIFIKSEKNYIDIQTTQKKYTLRTTLEKFLEELNDDRFLRVHKSFIINKDCIIKKTRLHIYTNDYEIPISRNIDFEI